MSMSSVEDVLTEIGNRFEISFKKWSNKMETNVRAIILKALENKGYLCELTKEGIIFVDDEDTNTGVAIHIQTTA